ncbi:MAG TPA: ribosome biogenesis GTP-binding protein YihA/YsxC [Steroidobacteraceae bacterium]|jgi:GTP-binding protein|nr:ribosome biogenesis GTP-binding protein YihA/YsxC [Steroidobacteraceae bacterium]
MSRFPDARFLVSAATAAQFPPDEGAEVAFAGRSNAGKSSAINAIAHRHALARTSKAPGRTRLLNFFELLPQGRIVDLPGYGYASAPETERRTWAPLIDALRARRSLCGLFLIVDARRGIADADEELIAWSNPQQRGVHVLMSKVDKLTRNEAARVLQSARARITQGVSVQLFSAHAGSGVAAAQGKLAEWLSNKKTPVTSNEVTGAD